MCRNQWYLHLLYLYRKTSNKLERHGSASTDCFCLFCPLNQSPKALAMGQAQQQIESPLRAIFRHHMARVAHQHLHQIARFLRVPGNFAIHLPDVPRGLLVVVHSGEVEPRHVVHRQRVGHDDVQLAVVDHHPVRRQQLVQVRYDRAHNVQLEVLLHLVLALQVVERIVTDVDRFACFRQLQELAHVLVRRVRFRLQVVEVRLEPGRILKQRSARILVPVDQLVEHVERTLEVLLRDAVATFRLVLVELVPCPRIDQPQLVKVVAVHQLMEWIAQPVADRNALQINVNLRLVVLPVDRVRYGGNVLASVRLASHKERMTLQVGKEGEELLQGVVQIGADVRLVRGVPFVLIGKAEPRSDGVINVNEVVVQVPAELTRHQLHLAADREGAIFREQPIEGRCPRATLQPEHDRSGGRVHLRRKVPEKEVRVGGGVYGQVARVAFDIGRNGRVQDTCRLAPFFDRFVSNEWRQKQWLADIFVRGGR
uniref:Uncharacterized protein n=1 Tax=Anopheles atroparvus TaxID=41427 RepID=A0AAG5D9R8_ANOAO